MFQKLQFTNNYKEYLSVKITICCTTSHSAWSADGWDPDCRVVSHLRWLYDSEINKGGALYSTAVFVSITGTCSSAQTVKTDGLLSSALTSV